MTNPWDHQEGGDHYKVMAIQPGEYIVANKFDWFTSNAIKYLSRHHLKGKPVEDLKKAIHYIQLRIHQLENDGV